MAIFVDDNTRLVVQGITGREGGFHTSQCREYGTNVVAGVTPGKGGQQADGVPVFNTVREAIAATKANTSMIFVPPAFAADAIMEAADAGIKVIEEINKKAKTWGGTDFTMYEGGVYSSEWFWAKILHVLKNDTSVRDSAYSWVEHCDWIPGILTGNADPKLLKRSRCAAGHKAMWHESFEGGLPAEE